MEVISPFLLYHTSVKIDFTTLNGSVFPVISTNLEIGWQKKVSLTRVANLVIVSSSSMVHNFTDAHSRFQLDEKVPSGYKPSSTAIFHGMTQDFISGSDDEPSWEVSTNGNMYISNRAGNCRFIVHGVWTTNDSWPTS